MRLRLHDIRKRLKAKPTKSNTIKEPNQLLKKRLRK
jgi:hypothetical protein